MKKAINVLCCVIIISLSAVFFIQINVYINQQNISEENILGREDELDQLVNANVIKIDSKSKDEDGNTKVCFTSKTFDTPKSKVIKCVQVLNKANKNNTQMVQAGDNVVVMDDGKNFYFQYFYRLDKIIILGVLFLIMLLILGKAQGLKTIITLLLTCLSIFCVFIPAIKFGVNIYFCTIAICCYIIFMTILILYGICKKSIITIISCCSGVLLSSLITLGVNNWLKMTGFLDETYYKISETLGFNIDLKAIMFSMITIGALGAVMDVAVSIVAPLCELQQNQATSRKELMHFGFSIGKDFMGSMTNTLILAYIGSSMVVVLLYSASNYPIISILNKEKMIFEILQSLIGSIGLLLTIPLTTIITSFINCHKCK